MTAERYKKSPSFENIDFGTTLPCRLRKMEFRMDTLSNLHYAQTLEIVLVSGLDGFMTVGVERFPISKNKRYAFVIAPERIHSSFYHAGEGCAYVFKLSFDILGKYLNLPLLLGEKPLFPENFFCDFSSRYDDFFQLLVNGISYREDRPMETLEGCLHLFRLLDPALSDKIGSMRQKRTDPEILRIMQWTEKHLSERIPVEEVARRFHYSKSYFSRLFRRNTGTTYTAYRNSLRIQRAIGLMKEGKSAVYCCVECGFNDLSYFIRIFRKVTGYTTAEFRNLQSENREMR